MRIVASRILAWPWFEPIVAVLILISVLLLIPEVSLPRTHPWFLVFERAQEVLTGFFFVELVIRYLAARRKRRFWSECWPDVLALIPILRVARFFRLLRLLRLYRLVSVASNSQAMQKFFFRQTTEYILVGFFIFFWLALGTLGLTHFEKPNEGSPALIENFWVSIFTMTQSEFANELPATTGGKIIVLCLELCGLTLFAVLTATASAVLIEKLREGSVLSKMDFEDLQGHVIICGWNSGMESTIQQLQRNPKFRDRDFLVIADRKELPELLEVPNRQKVRLVRDDFTRIEVLRKCRVDSCSTALIVSDVAQGRSRQDADARTVLAALTIEKMNPDVYTCAELSNAMNESHLRMGKVNEVVITQDLAGHLLAQAAACPASWRALHELVHPSIGKGFTSYGLPKEEVGQPFSEVMLRWIQQKGVLLVGVHSVDGQTRLNPGPYKLQEGDDLVGIPGT